MKLITTIKNLPRRRKAGRVAPLAPQPAAETVGLWSEVSPTRRARSDAPYRPWFWRQACALSFAFALTALLLPSARADFTLTDCTQPSLDIALAGGGRVTVNCDGTIVFSNTITIRTNVVLDATGRQLVLSGITNATATNAFRLFNVNTGASFSLINVTLANGLSTNGGAIYIQPRGFLALENCVLSNNLVFGADGRNGGRGRDSSYQSGRSGGSGQSGFSPFGGAIHNFRGTAVVNNCTFITNTAVAGFGGAGGDGGNGYTRGGNGGHGGHGGQAKGGAIYNAGTLRVTNSSFTANLCIGGDGNLGGGPGTGFGSGLAGYGGRGGLAAGAGVFNLARSVASFHSCTFEGNSARSGDTADAGDRRGPARSGYHGADSVGAGLCNYGVQALINCTFAANRLEAGRGGDGSTSDSRGGNGGNGGSVWGANVFNGSRTDATNCTFYDGTGTPGTNGTGGAAPFVGRRGSLGIVRGANLSSGAGLFTLKNCLLANPPNLTNRFSITNIACATNIVTTNLIICFTNVNFVTNINTIIATTNINCTTNPVAALTNVTCTTNITTTQTVLSRANAAGRFRDAGWNINSDASLRFRAAGSRFGIDPLLEGIGDNGGPTRTVALAEGSPAIDAGSTNGFPTTDQRGVSRPVGGRSDIGAFEFGANVSPPVILTQPQSQVAVVGTNVTFKVIAGGGGPYMYQWRHDGMDIDGATSLSLILSNVQASDAGIYAVIVSNDVGSTVSSNATLLVGAVADLFVTAATSSQIVSNGAPIVFTLGVTNAGTFTATNVSLSALLPATAQFVSFTNTLGSCTNDAGAVTCTVTDLATGAGFTLSITVTAGAGTNTCEATVASSTPDPNPANNTASASVATTVALEPLANAAPITFEEENSGPGSEYPSVINVSGLTGTIHKVTVTLHGLAHSFPDDLDILLVGPRGESVMLMSDAGLDTNTLDVTLTFDDDATNSLPDSDLIPTGSYKPTNYGTIVDVLPAPAPSGLYGSVLSVFRGSIPNGGWSLYAYDDTPENGGFIADGWSLNFTLYDTSTGTVTVASAPLQPASAITVGSPAVFQKIVMQTNEVVLLEFTGTPARSYTIEATGQVPDWQPIGSVIADGEGKCRFEDTNAPAFSRRFYRAITR